MLQIVIYSFAFGLFNENVSLPFWNCIVLIINFFSFFFLYIFFSLISFFCTTWFPWRVSKQIGTSRIIKSPLHSRLRIHFNRKIGSLFFCNTNTASIWKLCTNHRQYNSEYFQKSQGQEYKGFTQLPASFHFVILFGYILWKNHVETMNEYRSVLNYKY